MKTLSRHAALLLAAAILPISVVAQTMPRSVHVFVALADNEHQGIVPIPKALGNGDDAARNLYWGAAFGVKTFFNKSPDWEQIGDTYHPTAWIVERATFRHGKSGTLLVADAYRGTEIKRAISDFFSAASGTGSRDFRGEANERADKDATARSPAQLVVYVGHDGLMDFSLEKAYPGEAAPKRQAIILACASKQYFGPTLRNTGAEPLVWTTNLMAPEAYTLKAALDGWIAGETNEQIRERAAAAYAQYQKIGKASALKLFATGW